MNTKREGIEAIAIIGTLGSLGVVFTLFETRLEKLWRATAIVFIAMAGILVIYSLCLPRKRGLTVKDVEKIIERRRRTIGARIESRLYV